MLRSLVGSRIRELRRRSGISQTQLAKTVGISPSYLNLIEHNKRGIGGQILNSIAEALNTRASQLSESDNPTLLSDLRDAAERSTEPVEDLAARFPGWATLAAAQARKIRDQEAVISALSDRLSHDPFLSETVHGILSNVTAIRSTASILAQMEAIPEAQVKDFYKSLHTESVRLSDTTEDLAAYLARAGSEAASAATAEEALDQYLTRNQYHFEILDQETQSDLASNAALAELDETINAMLAAEPQLTGDAHDLVRAYLHTYAEDACAMPLETFASKAKEASFDPMILSRAFDRDLHSVFRRLANLHRPRIEAPQFGLITVSASGYPLLRQPLPGFALPRHGNACPLWPLFRSFSQPGQPLLADMEHDTGQQYQTLAFASSRKQLKLGENGDLVASMLIVAKEKSPFGASFQPTAMVGTACRICTRVGCSARTSSQLIQS